MRNSRLGSLVNRNPPQNPGKALIPRRLTPDNLLMNSFQKVRERYSLKAIAKLWDSGIPAITKLPVLFESPPDLSTPIVLELGGYGHVCPITLKKDIEVRCPCLPHNSHL